jgi:hypothetical protein
MAARGAVEVGAELRDWLNWLWDRLRGLWAGVANEGATLWRDVSQAIKRAAQALHDEVQALLDWLKRNMGNILLWVIGLAGLWALLEFGPELMGAYAVTSVVTHRTKKKKSADDEE